MALSWACPRRMGRFLILLFTGEFQSAADPLPTDDQSNVRASVWGARSGLQSIRPPLFRQPHAAHWLLSATPFTYFHCCLVLRKSPRCLVSPLLSTHFFLFLLDPFSPSPLPLRFLLLLLFKVLDVSLLCPKVEINLYVTTCLLLQLLHHNEK